MEDISDARKYLKEISYDYDVFIYSTAREDDPVTWHAKTEWILNNFGYEAARNLSFTHAKYVPRGDFLITAEKKEFIEFQGIHLQFGKGDFRKWRWIRDYFDSSSRNPLLSICRLALQNRWCLNLCCTTCGGVDFRTALRKISSGDIPITRWSHHMEEDIDNRLELDRTYRPFTPEQKRNILSICEEVNIQKLAEHVDCDDYPEPRYSHRKHFLMCFGLLLDHMSRSEDPDQGYTAEYKHLSNILCSKLLQYENTSPQNSEWLTRLIDDPCSWLEWRDLERFE
jgi:hypothetical protein